MAIIALEVPRGVGQYLQRLDVPGAKTPIDEMHVTIVQMDVDLSPIDVANIAGVVAELTNTMRAFEVSLHSLSQFPQNDHGVPVICPVVSEGLMLFQSRLVETLDRAGIEFSKKFPVYKPHVTVSWAQESIAAAALVRPIKWMTREIVLWPTHNGGEQAVHFDLRAKRAS